MSSFQQSYKCKPFGFGDVGERRRLHAETKKVSRKTNRQAIFDKNRNTSNSVVSTTQQTAIHVTSVVEDRMARLIKWKAERERHKKVNQKQKKPPFVVGIVHHKIYSPIHKDEAAVTSAVTHKNPTDASITVMPNSPKKRVTRATQKRLLNKAVVKVTKKNEVKAKNQTVIKKGEQVESFAPANHKFQAPEGLNRELLFGTVPMSPVVVMKQLSTSRLSKANKKSDVKELPTESPNVSVHSPKDPVFFSPYIVSSRGKSNARKEEKIKRGFSLGLSPKDDIPTKETVMKNLNISVEEEERTAQYFQFLLHKEIDRLNELCQKWVEIKGGPTITEDGQYEINQAIGQTNLLINKKFERFRRLVADCETGKGEMLVTCKDLQGFWDMMYMEVKNCDLRFEKLEKLRMQGWVEDEILVKKPTIKKKIAAKKKVTSSKPSSIRAFLIERKKKMAEGVNVNGDADKADTIQISSNKYNKDDSPSRKYKTRNSIGSPKENKFTPGKSDKRLSLLQKVQLSEASKKMKSPLTIMKVSQMCKTPEVQLDDTILYVNSDQTPGRSILKQPKSPSQVETHARSMNKVNFDDHIVLNEVPVDEETQTKMDLAAALARIESFDFEGNHDEVPIKAEKKLVFDDNSSDESESEIKEVPEVEKIQNKNAINIPQIRIHPGTPLVKSQSKNVSVSSSRRKVERQNAVDDSDENLQESPTKTNISTSFNGITNDKDLNTLKEKLEKHVFITDKEDENEANESIRVLRNRTISSIETPRAKKRFSRRMSVNIQEPEQKENKTPSNGRRSRRSIKSTNASSNENMDLSNFMDKPDSERSSNRRKSTRSVKFSEDKECSGCTPKSKLPMTPHVRKSKSKSADSKKRNTIVEEELIL